jgi:enoyl-CoA hydratase
MSLVEIERDGAVARLILNRPDKLNAFNAEMLKLFDERLDELEDDHSVHCIVLTGAGRAFCVGYDVSKDGNYHEEEETIYTDWIRLRKKISAWVRVWEYPKPIISAVGGFCMGAGTSLAVMTDITLVAEDAVIGWPTMPLGGGMLAPISSWLIGPKKAKEMSYVAGSRMSGIEAVDCGWANRAIPASQLDAEVDALARRIAKTPLDLLILKKQAINRVLEMQGFTKAVMAGAEFDAISHAAPAVESLTAKVREMGVKNATAWFRDADPEEIFS